MSKKEHRYPGGEILSDSVPLSDEELALGQELLSELSASEERGRRALAKISLNHINFFSIEDGRYASVIVIPRPDFDIVRQIKSWPAGEMTTIESDQPLRVRLVCTPTRYRDDWRVSSAVEPSPDYRYQTFDVNFAEFADEGHRLAVFPWQQPRT